MIEREGKGPEPYVSPEDLKKQIDVLMDYVSVERARAKCAHTHMHTFFADADTDADNAVVQQRTK